MGAVGSDFLTSVSVPSLPTSYHPVGKRSVMHADTKREVNGTWLALVGDIK